MSGYQNSGDKRTKGKLNEIYKQYARDLGFHINPARARCTTDKGKVEAKVKLKLSSLPSRKTLENFDLSFQPSISKRKIETLPTCEYLRRYERSSIIITINRSFREWPEVFAGNEMINVAILNRLLHHSHVINVRGKSWRLKEMEETLQFTTGLEKNGHKGSSKVTSSFKEGFSSEEKNAK